MKRVRTLFIGLLALFVFPFPCFATYPGECTRTLAYNKKVTGNPGNISLCSGYTRVGSILVSSGCSTVFTDTYYIVALFFAYFESGHWMIWEQVGYASASPVSGIPSPVDPSKELNSLLGSGCGSCDKTDSVGDGVCDACRTSPGVPQPPDCINQSARLGDGTLASMRINPGCSSSPENFEEYKNPAAFNEDGTPKGQLYFDMTPSDPQIPPKSCAGPDQLNDEGQCLCQYPAGSPGAGLSYDGKTGSSGGNPGGGDPGGGGNNGGGDPGGGDPGGGGNNGDGNTGGGDTGGSGSGTGGGGSGTGGGTDGTGSGNGDNGDGTGNGDDDAPDSIVAQGSGSLPSPNEYDPKLEDVEEDKLSDAIGNFISTGLPLMSYFKGTYISVDSSIPTLSFDFFGRPVEIDFSGAEDVLHFMGLVLVAVSTVLAFFIIIRRG